jgi:hypothetical protein
MVLSNEELEEKLAEAMGISDPTDEQLLLAEEEFLHGFSHAVSLIEDEDEQERLEELLEEQRKSFE